MQGIPVKSPQPNGKGLIFAIEGIDGAGKSEQVRILTAYLMGKGYSTMQVLDLPKNGMGKKIREIVCGTPQLPLVQLMLCTAARTDTYRRKVEQKIKDGWIAVYDRFVYTSVVYQRDYAYTAFDLHDAGVGKYADLTIVLDTPIDVAKERICNMDACEDVPDKEWEARRMGFRNLEALPDVHVVNCGKDSRETVFQEVRGAVDAHLELIQKGESKDE